MANEILIIGVVSVRSSLHELLLTSVLTPVEETLFVSSSLEVLLWHEISKDATTMIDVALYFIIVSCLIG